MDLIPHGFKTFSTCKVDVWYMECINRWSEALYISITWQFDILWSVCVLVHVISCQPLGITSPLELSLTKVVYELWTFSIAMLCTCKCHVSNFPLRSSLIQFQRAELALKSPSQINACLCVMRWLHSSMDSHSWNPLKAPHWLILWYFCLLLHQGDKGTVSTREKVQVHKLNIPNDQVCTDFLGGKDYPWFWKTLENANFVCSRRSVVAQYQ